MGISMKKILLSSMILSAVSIVVIGVEALDKSINSKPLSQLSLFEVELCRAFIHCENHQNT